MDAATGERIAPSPSQAEELATPGAAKQAQPGDASKNRDEQAGPERRPKRVRNGRVEKPPKREGRGSRAGRDHTHEQQRSSSVSTNAEQADANAIGRLFLHRHLYTNP